MNTESFERRHIGPTDIEIEKMLSLINATSIDSLIDWRIRGKSNMMGTIGLAHAPNEK